MASASVRSASARRRGGASDLSRCGQARGRKAIRALLHFFRQFKAN